MGARMHACKGTTCIISRMQESVDAACMGTGACSRGCCAPRGRRCMQAGKRGWLGHSGSSRRSSHSLCRYQLRIQGQNLSLAHAPC